MARMLPIHPHAETSAYPAIGQLVSRLDDLFRKCAWTFCRYGIAGEFGPGRSRANTADYAASSTAAPVCGARKSFSPRNGSSQAQRAGASRSGHEAGAPKRSTSLGLIEEAVVQILSDPSVHIRDEIRGYLALLRDGFEQNPGGRHIEPGVRQFYRTKSIDDDRNRFWIVHLLRYQPCGSAEPEANIAVR
jgi:hypothetical protein